MLILKLLTCFILILSCKAGDTVSQLRRELVASLDPTWFVPFNGYKYKLTSSRQSWTSSRSMCERMGGDLAAVGMRDYNTRRHIIRELSINVVWIGLNDIIAEGNYQWVDGVRGTSYNIPWNSGEPNNHGGNEDCAEFSGSNRVNDVPCTVIHHAICEVKI